MSYLEFHKQWHVFLYNVAVVVAMVLMAFGKGFAQGSLSGLTFANPNIGLSAGEIAGVDAMIVSKRDSIVNVKEKQLGRKMTVKELAKIDAEMEKGKRMIKAFQKAVKMSVTIYFKSAAEAEIKLDTQVNDKILKDAGVGWLQRKALKASFKIMPKSRKEKYVRKGNLIIFSPDEQSDTLRLSADGKQLAGKIMNYPFALKRQ